MALVATLAVVSLVALLTVATLSVATRLRQGSSQALRNARLDAAVAFALATAAVEWRQHSLGTLGIGSSRQFGVTVPGSPASASFMVTRVGAEVYWVVAEAVAGEARRRESLVLRLVLPRVDSLPSILAGGAVTLSPEVTLTRDTVAGCAPRAADLLLGPEASLSAANGELPPLTIERSAVAGDTGALGTIAGIDIGALAAAADLTLPAGSEVAAPSGVVHAEGNLVLTSGIAEGILIVDGQLTIAGPITYSGLIVARGGLVTSAPGAQLTGSIRTGPAIGALTELTHQLTIRGSACTLQAIVSAGVTPRPVNGRRWAEIF
jgi:hypothetical protein